MRKIKLLISILTIISIFGILNVNANTSTTSTSGGYNAPILDNSLNFKAYESNGYVYTSWTAFNNDESLKYYKVSKSTTTSNPIYPDNGYIYVSSDINTSSYVDKNINKTTTYYRVCAITNSNNRYCSNVVKIIPSNTNYTTTNSETDKVSTTSIKTAQLSYTLKIKADSLVNEVMTKLKAKYDDETIIDKIDLVNTKLKALKASNSKYTLLVDYLVAKFEEKRLEFDNGLNEIEKIFKDL